MGAVVFGLAAVAAVAGIGSSVVNADAARDTTRMTVRSNERLQARQLESQERMMQLQTQSGERVARMHFLNQREAMAFSAEVNQGQLDLGREQLDALKEMANVNAEQTANGWRFFAIQSEANNASNVRALQMLFGPKSNNAEVATRSAEPS